MSVKGFVVGLEANISDEDAEVIATALSLLRGVARVQPLEASSEDGIIKMRVQRELLEAILPILQG